MGWIAVYVANDRKFEYYDGHDALQLVNILNGFSIAALQRFRKKYIDSFRITGSYIAGLKTTMSQHNLEKLFSLPKDDNTVLFITQQPSCKNGHIESSDQNLS